MKTKKPAPACVFVVILRPESRTLRPPNIPPGAGISAGPPASSDSGPAPRSRALPRDSAPGRQIHRARRSTRRIFGPTPGKNEYSSRGGELWRVGQHRLAPSGSQTKTTACRRTSEGRSSMHSVSHFLQAGPVPPAINGLVPKPIRTHVCPRNVCALPGESLRVHQKVSQGQVATTATVKRVQSTRTADVVLCNRCPRLVLAKLLHVSASVLTTSSSVSVVHVGQASELDLLPPAPQSARMAPHRNALSATRQARAAPVPSVSCVD